MENIFSASRILALLIYFNKQGAVSKPLIKSDDEIASPFGDMLSIQTPDFLIYNFTVNIEFLDFSPGANTLDVWFFSL